MQTLSEHQFIWTENIVASPSPLAHPSTRPFKNDVGISVGKSAGYQPVAQQTDSHAVAMGALTVLVPLGLLLSIVAHRRLRTTVLQRRIAALEKLWRLNCHKKIQ